VPEIPENPAKGSARKRTKGARQEPPTARQETSLDESTPNVIEFASASPRGHGKDKGASGSGKKASRVERRAATPAGEAAPDRRDQARKESSAQSRAWRVPDSVQERFIQIGNNFHFPDGTEAFTHHGNKLTTRSENAIVIQSMVAIAREAGRGQIAVQGTEFFKKEAWFAASLAGLEVRGYAPTEFERERLARALAARRGGASSETGQPSTAAAQEVTGVGARAEGALIVGKLVDHGPAPYAHDPKQSMSYFVRVETEKGDREIWGVDLERAFRQSLSTPGIGDEIGLRAIGKAAVTVLAAKRDAQGREIGREEVEAYRNQWIVERKSFLDERQKMAHIVRDSSISASDAIKLHPELEGSYLQLQMGRALAEQQYASRGHREQFVEHLREHLARRIELGQPLEPVHLRSGEERTLSPHSPDRDYNATR
jgi:putative DNA primase/helicase